MNTWQERNEPVIKEFRENGGKVEGWAPLILLTTKGAKTGQSRIIPLMYVPYGNYILAIASKLDFLHITRQRRACQSNAQTGPVEFPPYRVLQATYKKG